MDRRAAPVEGGFFGGLRPLPFRLLSTECGATQGRLQPASNQKNWHLKPPWRPFFCALSWPRETPSGGSRMIADMEEVGA
jgi:hypothetical protein